MRFLTRSRLARIPAGLVVGVLMLACVGTIIGILVAASGGDGGGEDAAAADGAVAATSATVTGSSGDLERCTVANSAAPVIARLVGPEAIVACKQLEITAPPLGGDEGWRVYDEGEPVPRAEGRRTVCRLLAVNAARAVVLDVYPYADGKDLCESMQRDGWKRSA